MADNTYSILKESGYEPSSELLVRKILATTEHGKRYHLNINGDKRSSAFQIDGYITSDGKRCDKLVLVEKESEDWAEIYCIQDTEKSKTYRYRTGRKISDDEILILCWQGL